MITSKTPFRISLFGGGTDHPEWFRDEGGKVLSFAIDKYCYISLRDFPPFFDHKFRISYSIIERVKKLDDIEHPAVREGLRLYAPERSIELHHHADLPAWSGVGSSSAFAVGLINSLSRLTGKIFTGDELANRAIELEREILGETVGYQDQIACALGGINIIDLNQDGSWSTKKIENEKLLRDEVDGSGVLIYSGISRKSSEVSKTLLQNVESKRTLFRRLISLANEAEKMIVESNTLDQIGEMLDESWHIKKKLNPAAVSEVMQNFYDRGMAAGASGGKVLGAGGGGFYLFWVPKEKREEFIFKMNSNMVVPFSISKTGSEIVNTI